MILNENEILQALAGIVADIPHPTQYQFIPRDLILHLPFGWSEIQECLNDMADNGMVHIYKSDIYTYSITQKGLDKMRILLDQVRKN